MSRAWIEQVRMAVCARRLLRGVFGFEARRLPQFRIRNYQRVLGEMPFAGRNPAFGTWAECRSALAHVPKRPGANCAAAGRVVDALNLVGDGEFNGPGQVVLMHQLQWNVAVFSRLPQYSRATHPLPDWMRRGRPTWRYAIPRPSNGHHQRQPNHAHFAAGSTRHPAGSGARRWLCRRALRDRNRVLGACSIDPDVGKINELPKSSQPACLNPVLGILQKLSGVSPVVMAAHVNHGIDGFQVKHVGSVRYGQSSVIENQVPSFSCITSGMSSMVRMAPVRLGSMRYAETRLTGRVSG